MSTGSPEQPTPAAWWRVNGEPDPHGTSYDCQRHELTMGHVTDDELANEVFLKNYDIAVLQAGKERIRWLSRLAEKLEAENASLKAQLESSKDENLDNLKSFFELSVWNDTLTKALNDISHAAVCESNYQEIGKLAAKGLNSYDVSILEKKRAAVKQVQSEAVAAFKENKLQPLQDKAYAIGVKNGWRAGSLDDDLPLRNAEFMLDRAIKQIRDMDHDSSVEVDVDVEPDKVPANKP